MKVFGALVLGLLATTIAEAQVPGGRMGNFGGQRPMSTGERITAEAHMKAAIRAEVRAEAARQAAHERYQPRSYYRGPHGEIVDSHHIPPGMRSSYRYLGGTNPIPNNPYTNPNPFGYNPYTSPYANRTYRDW
jgi:hypothetical protein